jgi:ribosomal protein L11 methyltransferase
MDYYRVVLNSSPETLESDIAQLSALGFDTIQVEDERDITEQIPNWEMADPELIAYYKGLCRILIFLPVGTDSIGSLEPLRILFPLMEISTAKEEDWQDSWKQYYHRMDIGPVLVINPLWLEEVKEPGKVVFLSNPGMTFGTGLHASTQLCLKALTQLPVTKARVLDLGCGSGILGICALLLGGHSCLSIDIDPLATQVTMETATINGVEDKLQTATGNLLTERHLQKRIEGEWDLVFSNIVADVILPLMDLVPQVLAPNGVWIVSGIIDTRASDIETAAKAHNLRAKRWEDNSWVAFQLEK